MNNLLNIIKYFFIIVGIGFLLWTNFSYQNLSSLLSRSTETEGTVIKIKKSIFPDSSIYYYPIVKYKALNGDVFTKTASNGTYPSLYSKGDKVRIMYKTDDPKSAKVIGFFTLWAPIILTFIIGSGLFIIGSIIFIVQWLKHQKEKYFKKHGLPISAVIQNIQQNTNIEVNGYNPYQINAKWTDPVSNKIYLFKSKSIWSDPSPLIKNNAITVLINRKNPYKYYIDLSFLKQKEQERDGGIKV